MWRGDGEGIPTPGAEAGTEHQVVWVCAQGNIPDNCATRLGQARA